jgi:hypothetical protein
MDNEGVALFAGILFGAGLSLLAITNANQSYEQIGKAEQICEALQSTPARFDLDDELVCENGATVNYRTFGKTL